MDNNTADTLPSWHDHAVKKQIKLFISHVTDINSKHYVKPENRIACFDNDGTLWVEKPLNTQVEFIKSHIEGEMTKHPLRLLKEIKSLFDNPTSEKFHELVAELFHEMTTTEYKNKVNEWISSAKHTDKFKCLYTDLVYQPMQEVLALFEQHDFTNFIVTGGSANFVRPWSLKSYNISTERVLGSSLKTELVEVKGKLESQMENSVFFFDNGKNKALAIDRSIGAQPIACFGNSNGDIEMLRLAQNAEHSLSVLINHTDEEREYKYPPGHFSSKYDALDKANEFGWQVVDMKEDWKTIFNPSIDDK